MTAVDWREFDAVYLFNPFAEYYDTLLGPLDEAVAVDRPLHDRYVAHVHGQLERLAEGTSVVTYAGFRGELPSCYRLDHAEPAGDDRLERWIRARRRRLAVPATRARGTCERCRWMGAHRLASCPPRECRWLIDGPSADQGVRIVGGEPKCCNPFLELNMAVSVASGGRALPASLPDRAARSCAPARGRGRTPRRAPSARGHRPRSVASPVNAAPSWRKPFATVGPAMNDDNLAAIDDMIRQIAVLLMMGLE